MPPAGAAEPVVLQLRWHHQFQFAGYYMAKELGYYRAAGLDVELRAGSADTSPVDEVLDGNADFAIDGSGLLVDYARGRPVVALAAVFQKSPLRLIARADRGIHRLEDLAGRAVMLLPGYRSLSLVAMLNETGLLGRIDRRDSSTDIDDLLADRVAAFNGYNSNEPFALQQAGIEATIFDPADYGIQFYSDVLFTRADLAERRPELAEAFRQASLRGWQYAVANPAEAIELIRREYSDAKSVAYLRFEADAMRSSIMDDVVEIGHMNELRWYQIRDQIAGLGVIPRDLSLRAFLFRPPASAWTWRSFTPYLMLVALLVSGVLAISAFVIRKNLRLRDEILERQTAEKRAQYLATHDYLTGLPNRLLLMDRLARSLARARRHRLTPLLIYIDLDNFKALNDAEGHRRGDELLVEVTGRIAGLVREEDTFARMGGDEFVLLLDHMPPDMATAQAERLMAAVTAASRAIASPVDVTASLGLLVVDRVSDLTVDQALGLADKLMYAVKHESKNDYLVRRRSEIDGPLANHASKGVVDAVG